MATDPSNPFGTGPQNPYVVNQTDSTPQPPPPAAQQTQIGLEDDEVGRRPTTTKPRQRPNGAPADGSATGMPVGVQQGFASLIVGVQCGSCGATGEGPIQHIARLRQCGVCGSTDIGVDDDFEKTADTIETMIRNSLKGENYQVPAELVDKLTDSEVKAVWQRLMYEEIPPLYFDTGMGREHAVRYRAHNLVTDTLIKRQMAASRTADVSPKQCTVCGVPLTFSDGEWIDRNGRSWGNEPHHNHVPIPVGEARAAKLAGSVGTGEGYYVLKGGQPVSGPYDNPSYAHQDLPIVGGDAVEYLGEGHSKDLSSYPKVTHYPLRFGQPLAAKEAKVREIADGIMATNPGIDVKLARDLAYRTVDAFPAVIGARDQHATCQHCGKGINRGEGQGNRQWLHDHSGSGLCDDKQNTADPRREHTGAFGNAGPPPGSKCKDCGKAATQELLGHPFCDDHYWSARKRITGGRDFDAQTVLNQIGRGELMNVGAREFMHSTNYVQFTIGMGRPKYKAIVTLEADDTYTLEIGHLKNQFDWVSDYKQGDIYADRLGPSLRAAWNGIMENR